MGVCKSSKYHALISKDEMSSSGKDNKKKKPKKNTQSTSNSIERKISSPKGESSKKEKPTCAYCKNTWYEEHYCYKKDIDELKHLLDKNIISFPSRMSTSTSSHSKQIEFDKEKSHTFETNKSKGKTLCATIGHGFGRWIVD